VFTGRALWTASVYAPIDIAYQTDPLRSRAAEVGVIPPRRAPLGDVVYQEIPWRQAVREALANGRLPLWNRFFLAGEPLLAAQQAAPLSPATWIGLLLPLPQAWTFEMSLRIFLALASAYLLFREWEVGELAALFGAAAWAFCDYLLFYLGYPLGPAAAPFPLVVLGLRRLAQSPGRSAFGLAVAALFLVATSGHPESLLHVAAGAGVVFLFDLARAPASRRLPAAALAVSAGLLALGLCAVLLLPFAEAVPHTAEYAARRAAYAHSPRSLPLEASLRRAGSDLVPFGPGVWEPSSYAGAIVLPLAIVGVGSRRRERWPALVLAALGFVAFSRFPVLHDAICRLPLFDIAINERMAFLGAFALAALAALGVDRLAEGEGRGSLLFASAAMVGAVLLLARNPAVGVTPWSRRPETLRREIAPLALLALAAIAARPDAARRVPAALLALLAASRAAEAGGFYPTVPSRAFYPPLPLLDAIPRQQPLRIAAIGHAFVPNIAALYGLEDVRGYEAMTFAPLAETFPLWCVPQPVWYNRMDDPTRPFLAFLNVRYAIAPPGSAAPPGWRLVSEDVGGRLFENPSALPRAFAPARIFRELERTRQRDRLFAIRDFAAEGVLEAESAGGGENGPAQVRIESYSAERLEIAVDAPRGAVVATSVTAWPGWRLEIDGRSAALNRYNRAFLAFEVPAGRHRAALRYLPRSFEAGAAASGASVAILIAVLLRRRRPQHAGRERVRS
jgi:Bacterial membrane protein YfhO